MESTLLSKVQELFIFMQSRPIAEQMATFLSGHFCPSGEIAGVTVSRLQNTGEIECEVATGFLRNELIIGSKINIADDHPGGEVMRKLGILVLKKEDLVGKYSTFIVQDFMVDFKTAVIMNVTPRKMYAFALQSPSETVSGFHEYLDCIRSILNFYENSLNGEFHIGLREELKQSKDLTKRQAVILDLMKAHKTNATIATELGYSESLIRQQTIIIYRKLGVSGRKDLIPEMQDKF